MIELNWAGETFGVLGERALWWERRSTVCVADMHLGKAATFRAAGVPVPEGTSADLARVDGLVRRLGASRLVILGDLIHAKTGRAPETMRAFAEWRARHPTLDVLLVRGNHDVRAGDPPADWNVRIVDEPFADAADGGVAFAHYPEIAAKMVEAEGRAVLCGHVHPAVLLSGAVRGMRAPCFWFGERVGMLPAFGSFTGCKTITPRRGDRVFVVGGAGRGEVVDVSPRRAVERVAGAS